MQGRGLARKKNVVPAIEVEVFIPKESMAPEIEGPIPVLEEGMSLRVETKALLPVLGHLSPLLLSSCRYQLLIFLWSIHNLRLYSLLHKVTID